MKKSKNGISIVLILILSLLVVGMVGVIIMGTVNPKFFNFSFMWGEYTEIAASYKHQVDDVEQINLKTGSLSCRVYLTDEKEIDIRLLSGLNENQRSTLTAEKSGNTINAEAKGRIRIGINLRWEVVEVYLPKIYKENLRLESSSGSIKIEDSLEVKDISIGTGSGSIRVTSLNAENYDISATSGSVKFENINGDGSLKTNSGSIRGDYLKGEKHSIQSSSGSLRLGEASGEIDAKTTSGSISFDELTGSGSFKSSSGSIKLYDIELQGDLSLKSTSGSIRVQFASTPSATISASANSGSVRLNGFDGVQGRNHDKSVKVGSGRYKVEATATSGSITIEM